LAFDSRYDFKIKIPKSRYIIVEANRVSNGGRLGAVLPPILEIGSEMKKARANLTNTGLIAAKLVEVVGADASDGDQGAKAALSNQSISIADALTLAKSINLTVLEQKAQNKGSPIDLKSLASGLIQKSNEKMAALVAEGKTAQAVAQEIAEKTYDIIFGENADLADSGILAHRTFYELGVSAAAARDVSYETIKSINSSTMRTVEEAFRTEANAYRTSATLQEAVALRSTVSSQYSVRFTVCYTDPSSCASSQYTPPPPLSSGGGSSIPVISISLQPSNQTAAAGNATFSVVVGVSNGSQPAFQWQKKENGSVSFVNIPGAMTSSLSLSNLTHSNDNGDQFRVIISAPGGASSVTSSVASLSVANPLPGAPTNFQGAPQPPTANEISLEKGTVNLTWSAPASYGASEIVDYLIEYRVIDSTDWTLVNDGISNNLNANVPDLNSGLAYEFRVIAKNSFGTGAASSVVNVVLSRDLFFKNSVPGRTAGFRDWNQLSNWYVGGYANGSQASRFPGPYDNVYLYEPISGNSGSAPLIANLTVSNQYLAGSESCETPGFNCRWDYPNIIFSLNISVTGVATFKTVDLDPPAFSGGSVGQEEFSTITGNAVFLGSAFQYGIVSGSVTCNTIGMCTSK